MATFLKNINIFIFKLIKNIRSFQIFLDWMKKKTFNIYVVEFLKEIT
jgi:hypothetical protein